MMECPCKECITYAMCRTEVRSMVNPNVSHLSHKKGCEPLIKYLKIDTYAHIVGNESRIDKARVVFGLSSLW